MSTDKPAQARLMQHPDIQIIRGECISTSSTINGASADPEGAQPGVLHPKPCTWPIGYCICKQPDAAERATRSSGCEIARCVPVEPAPAQPQVQCRHKEINDEGICKTCGAKAAIRLPFSVEEFNGMLRVPNASKENAKAETKDSVDTCLICQKEIPPGPDFCSDECAEKARMEMEIEKMAPTQPTPHTVGFKPLFNEAVQPKAEAMTAEQFWRGPDANEPLFCRVQGQVDFDAVFAFAEAFRDHSLAGMRERLAEKDKNYRAMAESEFELRRELDSLREERNKAIELLRELPITSMAMKITLAPKWVERVCGLLGGAQIEPGKAGDDK